jgi:hypothetical protein
MVEIIGFRAQDAGAQDQNKHGVTWRTQCKRKLITSQHLRDIHPRLYGPALFCGNR